MSTPQELFYGLIEDFTNAMLVSQDGNALHARPMAVAKVDTTHHKLWFATHRHTDKVHEILKNPSVSIAFQNVKSFASIKGNARVFRDQALINELWSESWRAWFPEGKESEGLVLIEVEARHGEFWDVSSGKGLSMLVDTTMAYITGDTPAKDRARHDSVPLGDDEQEFTTFAT